jgi:hypothetical protein
VPDHGHPPAGETRADDRRTDHLPRSTERAMRAAHAKTRRGHVAAPDHMVNVAVGSYAAFLNTAAKGSKTAAKSSSKRVVRSVRRKPFRDPRCAKGGPVAAKGLRGRIPYTIAVGTFSILGDFSNEKYLGTALRDLLVAFFWKGGETVSRPVFIVPSDHMIEEVPVLVLPSRKGMWMDTRVDVKDEEDKRIGEATAVEIRGCFPDGTLFGKTIAPDKN